MELCFDPVGTPVDTNMKPSVTGLRHDLPSVSTTNRDGAVVEHIGVRPFPGVRGRTTARYD
jgi:hypothetical protein